MYRFIIRSLIARNCIPIFLKRLKKEERASISLLASICIVSILTLESVLLPAAFFRLFEAQVPDYMNLQSQTILASYKRDLFKRYALMGFLKSEARTSELTSLINENRIKTYSFKSELSVAQALGEPEILKKAVLKYMKPRLPLSALRTFRKRFSQLRKCLESSKRDLVNISEDASSVQGKLTQLKAEVSKNKQESKWQKLLARGLERAIDYCFDGYSQFKMLATEANVQTATIANFANLLNNAKNILNSLERINLPLFDDILLNEYIISFLSSAVRNSKSSIPSSNQISDNLTARRQSFQSLTFASPYETESCMSFFNGQAAYIQVQTQIFALRFALQILAVCQNKQQQAIFQTVGQIISFACALLGIPLPPSAVQHFLTAITAGIRAFKELKILQAGKMLPLLPDELINKKFMPQSLASFQHDYFDYSRLFLLLTPREHRLRQLYRAIQGNLPGDYYCSVTVKASWQAPKWIFFSNYHQSQLSYLIDKQPIHNISAEPKNRKEDQYEQSNNNYTHANLA